MDDLIAQLEAATGPDLELNHLISLEIRCPNWRELKPWEMTNGWAKENNARDAWSCLFRDAGGNPEIVPNYTASFEPSPLRSPT